MSQRKQRKGCNQKMDPGLVFRETRPPGSICRMSIRSINICPGKKNNIIYESASCVRWRLEETLYSGDVQVCSGDVICWTEDVTAAPLRYDPAPDVSASFVMETFILQLQGTFKKKRLMRSFDLIAIQVEGSARTWELYVSHHKSQEGQKHAVSL